MMETFLPRTKCACDVTPPASAAHSILPPITLFQRIILHQVVHLETTIMRTTSTDTAAMSEQIAVLR